MSTDRSGELHVTVQVNIILFIYAIEHRRENIGKCFLVCTTYFAASGRLTRRTMVNFFRIGYGNGRKNMQTYTTNPNTYTTAKKIHFKVLV